jgi:hypothetical protein
VPAVEEVVELGAGAFEHQLGPLVVLAAAGAGLVVQGDDLQAGRRLAGVVAHRRDAVVDRGRGRAARHRPDDQPDGQRDAGGDEDAAPASGRCDVEGHAVTPFR